MVASWKRKDGRCGEGEDGREGRRIEDRHSVRKRNFYY